MNGRILITGAAGQVGIDLLAAMQTRYGVDQVVAASHRTPLPPEVAQQSVTTSLDATDAQALAQAVRHFGICRIVHLATILSADGERDPERAWRVNVGGLKTVLDVAVSFGLEQVFWPSSIAVFGPTTPRDATPQRTVLEPTTMYGVTKLAGEALCNYFAGRHRLDVRSVRYPGLVSYSRFSGGGTTDYSVEMFIAALLDKTYRCFVRADTILPLMFIDDAIRGTLELMEAPANSLSVRTSYNLAALSFSAGELAEAIRRVIPDFTSTFEPDFRQAIADSWPRSIDDSAARKDWGWQPEFDLERLVGAMLEGLSRQSHPPQAQV